MTLNTILHTPVQNEVEKYSSEPLAVNELLEELTDEELNTLEAMLRLFLGYSRDCWNNQLGKPDSELFFLWDTPPSELIAAEEELELQRLLDSGAAQ